MPSSLGMKCANTDWHTVALIQCSHCAFLPAIPLLQTVLLFILEPQYGTIPRKPGLLRSIPMKTSQDTRRETSAMALLEAGTFLGDNGTSGGAKCWPEEELLNGTST